MTEDQNSRTDADALLARHTDRIYETLVLAQGLVEQAVKVLSVDNIHLAEQLDLTAVAIKLNATRVRKLGNGTIRPFYVSQLPFGRATNEDVHETKDFFDWNLNFTTNAADRIPLRNLVGAYSSWILNNTGQTIPMPDLECRIRTYIELVKKSSNPIPGFDLITVKTLDLVTGIKWAANSWD